jgi:hypothetical protein
MYAESNSTHHFISKMTQSTSQTQLHCANCDIDILWPATVVRGTTYCCTGCAAGGPCSCDYSQYDSVKVAGVIHYGRERPDAIKEQEDGAESPS